MSVNNTKTREGVFLPSDLCSNCKRRMNGRVELMPKFKSDYDTCSTEIVVLVIWTSAALSTGLFCCAS